MSAGDIQGAEMTQKVTDYLVNGFSNPEALDRTLNALGPAVLIGVPGNYEKRDGYYVMRVFGNPGFIEFAVEHQGYCKIVKKLAQPAPNADNGAPL